MSRDFSSECGEAHLIVFGGGIVGGTHGHGSYSCGVAVSSRAKSDRPRHGSSVYLQFTQLVTAQWSSSMIPSSGSPELEEVPGSIPG